MHRRAVPTLRGALVSDNSEHLARVASSIGETVIAFVRGIGAGGRFYASALRDYVTDRHPCIAPESPGRILRELKRRGDVHYELVSRAESLYEVVRVRS